MRSRTTTTALGVGFVLVSATSLPLLLQPDYGQRYFWFVFVHWILGLVLLPLYYFVLASHLSTILGRYRTFLIFLFLIPVTFAGGIGPPFVSPWHNPLTVPIALLTFAIYWFLRRGPSIFGRKLRPLRLFQPLDPEEHPLTVWSGVGALVASWMILNTGFALTLADFKFANDKYFLHGPVAMLLFPLLAVHFAFWGRRYGRRPAAKTKVLLVGVAIASVALCGMSIYKNLAPLDYQRGETIVRVATQGVGTGPPKPLPAGALEVLDDSKPCQACHDEIAERWSISSHRFAGLNKLYLALLPEVAKDLGVEGVRYCDNCHEPVLALDEMLDHRFDPETLARSEGVSCKVCHFLEPEAHPQGNGVFPLVLVKGLGFPGAVPNASNLTALGRQQVSIDARLHIRSTRRPEYQTTAACRPCHVVEIPAAFNGVRDVELTPLFRSHEAWSGSREVGCMDCHMTNVDRDRQAYRQWDHRFPAANQALALMVPEQYREQTKESGPFTESFLHGTMRNSDDRGDLVVPSQIVPKLLWGGTHLPMKIAVEPTPTANRLALRITTSSAEIGHDFPVDLADQADTWLEVRVLDAGGRTVLESGGLDAGHRIVDGTRTLGGELVDRDGTPLAHHEIWRLAEIRNRRSIPPSGSREETFDLALDGTEQRPLRVTARWMYRRVNQAIADWLYDDGTTFPVTELSRAEQAVP